MLGQGPETFGLVHGDLHQENYLFHQGQVRAIDFDDCGFGHYIYDIAVTLFNVRFRDNTPQLRESFLAGYRSIRPLSAEHEQYLDTFAEYVASALALILAFEPAANEWLVLFVQMPHKIVEDARAERVPVHPGELLTIE